MRDEKGTLFFQMPSEKTSIGIHEVRAVTLVVQRIAVLKE
jgi:hypothetical protein